MKYIIICVLFFILLLLESTILPLPLILLFLLCITILFRSGLIFFIGLFSGFFLDALSFRPIGQSSIFFVVFLFFIFLYERKFELQSVLFVLFMSCIGSIVFFFLFGSTVIVLQVIASIAIAVLLFLGLTFYIRCL